MQRDLKFSKVTLLFYVNGFNSSMEYKTKVVECNLVFGDEKFSVPAICVPSIRNALTLPGLSALLSEISAKGYPFADAELGLSDKISNIDFVLGAGALICLLDRAVAFGN